jgi:hypothetical protein
MRMLADHLWRQGSNLLHARLQLIVDGQLLYEGMASEVHDVSATTARVRGKSKAMIPQRLFIHRAP